MILEEAAAIRTPQGFSEVWQGDIIFFEAGEADIDEIWAKLDK